jgi:hypothetical protein
VKSVVASTSFFDAEDAYFVTTDLWLISNAAVCIIGVIVVASERCGGLVLADDFSERMPALMRENERLKDDFMASDRFKAAAALIEANGKKG